MLWHVSDEPDSDVLDHYLAARAVVDDLLADETIADALSDHKFAATGAVDVPIVATDAVEPFLADDRPFWVYYCVAQQDRVANRFIAHPAVRTRVIGRQIFVARAQGFLHWGFNFYATHHTLAFVDPFRDTSAGGAFPAGDAFIVYPGAEGQAWPSIRHRMFAQAMYDHRALQLLAELQGRDHAASLVNEGGTLQFDHFDYDVVSHLTARRSVDEAINRRLRATR